MVNFGDVIKNIDLNAFQPVPKGEYEIRIREAEATIAKSSGREMIKAVFEIVEGPNEGRRIFNNFVWVKENPNAQRMFFVNMGAFGFDKDYFLANPSMEKLANDLTNKPALVKIDHREWNDQLQEDVKSIKPSKRKVSPTGEAVPNIGNPAPAAAPAPAPTPAPAPQAPPAPAAAPEAAPAGDTNDPWNSAPNAIPEPDEPPF